MRNYSDEEKRILYSISIPKNEKEGNPEYYDKDLKYSEVEVDGIKVKIDFRSFFMQNLDQLFLHFSGDFIIGTVKVNNLIHLKKEQRSHFQGIRIFEKCLDLIYRDTAELLLESPTSTTPIRAVYYSGESFVENGGASKALEELVGSKKQNWGKLKHAQYITTYFFGDPTSSDARRDKWELAVVKLQSNKIKKH